MTLKRESSHPQRPPRNRDNEHAYLNLPNSPTPPPSPPPRRPHVLEPSSSTSPPVVLLIYSKYCSVALEWARYLDRVYHILSKSKRELTIRHIPVEDLGSGGGGSLPHNTQLSEASLQVLLLSRPLLNLLLRRPQLRFGPFLRPERVLGIMLGVEDALLNARHREALSSFDQWVHLEAKHNDTAFVHTVINFSIQILSKPESKINNLDQARRIKYLSSQGGGESSLGTAFQVFPRTLYEKGDTSILLVFQFPIEENTLSDLRIFLRRAPHKLPPLPLEKLRLLNPYNISCILPACAFLLRSSEAVISVEMKGRRLDVKEPVLSLVSAADQFESALNTVTDPVRVLCTTYGINPPCKNRLDETLTEAFLSKRSSFLLSASIESLPEEEDRIMEKGEFPTLLHFASHYGFEKLTRTLLDCPAFERALYIRNELGCTPSDLARNNGFFALSHTLDEKASSLLLHHEYSDIMGDEDRCFIEDANYSIPPAPIPVKLRSPGKSTQGGGTLRPKRASALDVVFEPDRFDHDRYGTMKGNKAISKRLDFEPPKQQEVVVGKEFKEDLAVADELLKLLDDFQKNSYSFSEMEALFKKWRRRKAEMPSEENGKKSSLSKKSTFRKLFTRSSTNNKKNSDEDSLKTSLVDTTNNSDCYQTDENELSVVVFPPSPGEKSGGTSCVDSSSTNAVSSQILPLSRLSSVSSSTSRRSLSPPPFATTVPNNTLDSSKKNAAPLGTVLSEIHFTPQSMDEEESILNTPKSLLPSQEEENNDNEGGDGKSSSDEERASNPPLSSMKKQLFPSTTTTFVPQQLEEYANLPSMIITDFE